MRISSKTFEERKVFFFLKKKKSAISMSNKLKKQTLCQLLKTESFQMILLCTGSTEIPESTKILESNQNTGKHINIKKAPCNRGILRRKLLKINCLRYIDNFT